MLRTFVETSRVKGRVFWGSSHCKRVGWEIRPQSDSLRIGPCNLRFAPVLVPNTDVREHVLRKGLRDIAPAPSLGNWSTVKHMNIDRQITRFLLQGLRVEKSLSPKRTKVQNLLSVSLPGPAPGRW